MPTLYPTACQGGGARTRGGGNFENLWCCASTRSRRTIRVRFLLRVMKWSASATIWERFVTEGRHRRPTTDCTPIMHLEIHRIRPPPGTWQSYLGTPTRWPRMGTRSLAAALSSLSPSQRSLGSPHMVMFWARRIRNDGSCSIYTCSSAKRRKIRSWLLRRDRRVVAILQRTEQEEEPYH
jgi:hypothetical protein